MPAVYFEARHFLGKFFSWGRDTLLIVAGMARLSICHRRHELLAMGLNLHHNSAPQRFGE
jgi:hypothetical protein